MDGSPEDTTGSLWRRLEAALGFLNHGQELQPQELAALGVVTLKQRSFLLLTGILPM